MKPHAPHRTLVLIENGKPSRSFSVPEGITPIGREPGNGIILAHSSVSRLHAQLTCQDGRITVADLDSRNGIHVNGVPRKEAALQTGDKLQIGNFVLELAAVAPSDAPALSLGQTLEKSLRLDRTLDQNLDLPRAGPERQLATLYHVCFWIAEGIAEKEFNPRCLDLLRESLRAGEAHFYSPDHTLQSFSLESGTKPSIKLAAFLAKMFQEASESICIEGQSIARHQRGVGQYNFLVAPLRPSQAETASHQHPFVVLLRSNDQTEFSTEDRVLLQAICQLWVRGVGKSNQLIQLRNENRELKEKAGHSGLLGSSPALRQLREEASRAARTNVGILLIGESGSGKELVAQFVHDQSPRHEGPLIKLNCAAIPDALIESELFGYIKGAFSGAVRDHRGKFAQAHHGTLFLDEIGEMPLLVQAKVLRAIENREVQPLGSEETVHADIRIVAATNRDLKEMVRDRVFREDLYFRLDVQKIRIPPLREHVEDIAELTAHFLKRFCAENGLADMNFTDDAILSLQQYPWPGNVRELWNVVQRCALATASCSIASEDVAKQLSAP